jgi:hypothetical protein
MGGVGVLVCLFVFLGDFGGFGGFAVLKSLVLPTFFQLVGCRRIRVVVGGVMRRYPCSQ